FLGDLDKSYKTTLPLPQLACVHRSLLQRIKAGPMQRLFHPVSPDVVLALLMLNEAESVCEIDSPLVLYVSSLHSNGRSLTQKQGETGRQFLRQLPGGESDCYDLVPIKCISVCSVYNDFQRTRLKVGGRLAQHELNWIKYFLDCYQWMLGPMSAGVDMTPTLREWERALSEQPSAVQQSVREALAVRRLAVPSALDIARKQFIRKSGADRLVRWCKHLYRGRFKQDPEWRFTDAISYYEWECEQIRAATNSSPPE
ncbi:MAG: hypothetical protein EB082_19220, partial [Verrucomicrobia bacterium]|nr:hypothetical protein [Verrucomicrobiota bacterium]